MTVLNTCYQVFGDAIVLGAILGVVFAIFGIALSGSDKRIFRGFSYVIFTVSAIIFLVGLYFGATGLPSKKAYTVEINSPKAFQWLAENNYKITERVYESKDIYIIEGKPLPENIEADW